VNQRNRKPRWVTSMSSLHEHHEEPPSGLPHSRIPVPKPRDDQRCEAVGVGPHCVPSACSAKRLEHLVCGLGVAAAGAEELPATPCCRAPSPGSVLPHSLPLLLSFPWARPELWLAGGEASTEQGRGGGLERGRGAAAVPSGTTKAWRRP